MSQLLSFDLVKMEANLNNQVKNFRKPTEWDVYYNNGNERDMKAWNKMMGTGKTPKTRSTRKCLDSKRHFNTIIGDKTKVGVTL